MKAAQSATTAGAAGAGAAFGGLVAWGIGAVFGVEVPPEQYVGFCTLGAFAFGRIFPR
jgi:hypothetical protein